MFFRITLAAFCLLTLTAQGQRNPELIHSGEEIEKGIEDHDEGNYEEALEHYRKVHPADTNYLTAVYERALTNLEMENYEKVFELCEKAIALNYHEPEVYNTYGSALDYSEKQKEALEIYDRGLEEFPYNMSLQFNRALVYENMDQRKKTIEDLQDLARFNPFHASSHFRLGIMSSMEGLRTQAIISLVVGMAVEPGSGRSLMMLSYADQVASGGAEDIGTDDKDGIESEFEELDLIVKNRLAINDKYETPSDLGFPVIKQAHLIMTQIQKGEATSDGFWGSYYSPILKWIMDSGNFENFAMLISISVDDNYVRNLIERNIDDIRDFRGEFITKMRELYGAHSITRNGEELAVEKWFHDDFSLQAFGAETSNGKNDGYWEYYYTTGQIETIGEFDKGDRIGTWISFNPHGDTSQIHHFENGKLNGLYKTFHDNGTLSEMGMYEDGELNGELEGYFDTGQLRATMTFKDGKREGSVKFFYKTGELEREFNMVGGELHGEMIDYYPSGQVSSRLVYEDGEREGESESFYPDGTLQQKTVYKDDEIEGPYVTYYQNGQVKSSGNAKDGSVAGAWKYFYMDGSLEETSDFSENGKINGESISYDLEERPYQIEEFKNGDIKRITFLDEEGNEIASNKERRGELTTEFYNYHRKVVSKGTFKDGERTGTWQYFENGELEEEENYVDGDLHGPNTSWFPNGNIDIDREFKYGEATDYYLSKYRNDTVYAEGNYYKDNRECTWYYYHPNGEVEYEYWYEKGQRKGEQKTFSITGNLTTISIYDKPGVLSGYISFDTLGNAIDTVMLKNGTGKVVLKGNSGKDYFKGEYRGGEAHGIFQWLYPDGSVETEGNYQHDERTGTWNYYHPNGQISSQGDYEKGSRHGTWNTYDYFGNPITEREYFHGDLHGQSIFHYPGGGKRSVNNYEYGERHGPSTFYTPDGTIIIQRNYDKGKLVSYTYLGENGELKAPIEIENETAKIEAFFPNGNKSAEYEIVRGWFQGDYKLYYEDGTLLKEVNYIDDYAAGGDFYYYPDGSVWQSSDNKFGEVDGVEKEFYKNGQIKSEINYIMGQMHGKCEYFDKAGKSLDRLTYYNDDPVKM
ncbi:hypothetical protein [Halocola ammonii]